MPACSYNEGAVTEDLEGIALERYSVHSHSFPLSAIAST